MRYTDDILIDFLNCKNNKTGEISNIKITNCCYSKTRVHHHHHYITINYTYNLKGSKCLYVAAYYINIREIDKFFIKQRLDKINKIKDAIH